MSPVQPAYAWGLVIPSATGKGLFMAARTASTRREIIEEHGLFFASDWRRGWRRAYREGYRAVRVVIRPGFDR